MLTEALSANKLSICEALINLNMKQYCKTVKCMIMMKVSNFLLVMSFFFFACNLNAQKTITDPCERKVLLIWKEQVEFVKECAEKNMKDLKLVGYKELGEISSQPQLDEYLKRTFADDTKGVFYLNETGTRYEILPLKEGREKERSMRQKDTYDLIQKQLTKELKIGMELIELQWEYKGEAFNSVAVAHEDGKFVYDSIGSLVLLEK